MSINKVVLTGNLTRDAELRYSQSGMAISSIGIAVNDRTKNSSTGDWEDYANFINCVMFGKRAEALDPYLKKGQKVAIDGKLRYSAWESDGQRRSKIEVVIDDLELLGSRGNGGGGQGNAPSKDAYSAPQTPVVNEDASVYSEDVPF
jgi:single-strand DNA-binding protein